MDLLRQYKINTMGSTGLIFQGAINDISSRSPSELTQLFETLSGSAIYSKPYNLINQNIQQCKIEYKDLSTRKRQLQQEIKQFKNLDSNATEYQELLQQYKQAEELELICRFKILQEEFNTIQCQYTNLEYVY